MSWKVVKGIHITYSLVRNASILTDFRHVLADVGDNGMGVQNKLGLMRGEVSGDRAGIDWTHVEYLEEPIQVRFPRRNHVFVTLGVNKSNKPVPFASFDDPLLDFFNSPAIASTVNGRAGDVYRWLNLRCKLIYCVACRLAEIIQFLPAHSPFKGCAYIGAGRTEIDILLIVGHRILEMSEPRVPYHGRGGDSLGPW